MSLGAFSFAMSSPASANPGNPTTAMGDLRAACGVCPGDSPLPPQSVSPGCIHSMLLLAEKEPVSHRERLSGVQVSLSLSPELEQ